MVSWRVFLNGHPYDLDTLVQLFPAGSDPYVALAEDGTYYLAGASIDTAEEASEALTKASEALPILNGAGRIQASGFQTVRLSEQVSGGPDDERQVFVFGEVRMESRARLTVGDPRAPNPSPVAAKAVSDAVLTEAVVRMGKSSDLHWIDLYKIFEVLRDGAGGEPALRQRTGVTKAQVSRFTHTANHPGGSGDLARHARLPQQAPTDPMTLEEGQDFIRKLISSW